MNAIEFVKRFGLDYTKHVLCEPDEYKAYLGDTSVNDLKQIVKAFELVEKRGGLAEAKAIEQQYWNSGVGSAMIVSMELKQAIELVEGVCGG